VEVAPSAPLLLGRGPERRALQEVLAEVRGHKRLGLVQLQGPPGAGRTALLDDLERHGRSEGFAILRTSPPGPESESYEPGRMIARVLGLGVMRGGSLDAAFLRAVQDWGWPDPLVLDGLRRLIQPRVRFPDPRDGALRAGFVTSFVERLAERQPGGVLLVLQDLHAQRDCLSFAQHIVQEELEIPLMVVLSYREGVLPWRSREAVLLEAMGRRDGCTTMRLGPIPGPEALALARRMGLSSSDAARAAQLSAGRLEALVELARDRREREELLLLSEPIQIQAARLSLSVESSGMGHRSLEMAAVLGRSVRKREWENACVLAGIIPPAGLLPSLYRRRLLVRTAEGFAFRRRALYQSLLSGVRERNRVLELNLLAASALIGTDELGVCERRANHLILAERPVDGAASLMEAARLCFEAGNYDDGVRLLARREHLLGRISSQDEESRALGLMMLAEGLRHLGRSKEAVPVSAAAERRARWSGNGVLRVQALVCQACTRLSVGNAGGALSALRDARGALGPGEPAPRRMDILEGETLVALGDGERAMPFLERALLHASDLDAAQVLRSVAVSHILVGRMEEAERALDDADTRAWSAQSATEAAATRMLRARLLERQGGMDTAREVSEGAASLVRRSGLPYAMEPDLLIASWELSQGHHAAAFKRLEAAGRWMALRGRSGEYGLVRLMVASAQISLGSFETGAALLQESSAQVEALGASSERLLPLLKVARHAARQARETALEERLHRLLDRQERMGGRHSLEN
jgi:tetratricopeptide (TPR) repeat protein